MTGERIEEQSCEIPEYGIGAFFSIRLLKMCILVTRVLIYFDISRQPILLDPTNRHNVQHPLSLIKITPLCVK